MGVVGAVLGIVLIGVGVTFLPTIKTFVEATFAGLTSMDAFLTLLVSVWPIIAFMFFVFGAYVLLRRGN